MKIAHFEPWPYFDLLNRTTSPARVNRPSANWSPAVDILEEDGRFLVRADVPGVDAKDIDVSMDAGVLTVSGTREQASSEESVKIQRSERASGRFFRRFTLPESADADRITAKSSNGILEVSIPKLPEIEARRIAVEAA